MTTGRSIILWLCTRARRYCAGDSISPSPEQAGWAVRFTQRSGLRAYAAHFLTVVRAHSN